MSTSQVLSPTEFESRLERYLFERSEEGRAVRVGEKEVSEQAAIVRRYADLFTSEQLDAMHEAEDGSDGEWRELLPSEDVRGRLDRERADRGGGRARESAARDPCDVRRRGVPLRTAQAKLAVLPSYADRDELGQIQSEAARRQSRSAGAPPPRRCTRGRAVRHRGCRRAQRGRERHFAARSLRRARAASIALTDRYEELREKWFDGCSVPAASPPVERPCRVRPAPLAARGDVHEGAGDRGVPPDAPGAGVRPCRATQHPARPRRPAAEVTSRVRDRERSTESRPSDHSSAGRLHDYQAFLHEAGHALHYGGCDPELPYTFRRIARDHALTEIYSYIVEAISQEPGWHERYFGLSAERPLRTRRRRPSSKRSCSAATRRSSGSSSTSGHGSRPTEEHRRGTPTGSLLPPATHIDARAISPTWMRASTPPNLRAWIRSSQLRSHLLSEVGDDWWCNSGTGDLLRDLFLEGTKPTSEEIAGRSVRPARHDAAPAGARRLTASP